MIEFLSGAFVASSVAIALFFYRFWRTARDRLFALLALAFLLLGVERAILSFVPAVRESQYLLYSMRLAAFVLIIIGILDKNRAR